MKKDLVLQYLRENRRHFISGEELSRRLKVTRTAVWNQMQQLRSLGYEIEAQPHLGYRLAAIPDKLFTDELESGLGTAFVGNRILSYGTLDSTNDAARKLGEENSPEGTCVFAEHQKKGRGRLGRSWESPKGKNLLFSILLRPSLGPAEASKMTLVAGVSLAKTLETEVGRRPGLKWPNDIVYGRLKAGGILTEMEAEADRIQFVVIGIGLNVNAERKDLPAVATSLRMEAGAGFSRVSLAQSILRQFEKDYTRFKEGRFKDIAREWEEYSATSGKRVVASAFGKKIEGVASGIDEEGALWIRRDSGLQERITAGDVEHLR